MDEKELKKLLDKELDGIAPSMSSKVRKAPIVTSEEKREKSTHKVDITVSAKRNFKPVVFGAIAAVLVIAIALAVVLPPMFEGNDVTAPVYEAGYLRMDINPSVEFVFDKENKVTAVKSANGDADLLLSDELRAYVKGLSVDQAAAAVAEEAGRLGYISPDEQNAIRIVVVASTSAQSEEVTEKTSLAVENNFMRRGVYCAVVAVQEDVDYILDRYGAAADDLSGALENVVAKSDFYFGQLAAANQNSLEELKKYYEQEVFAYLKGLLEAECIKIGRTRELLKQAQQINNDITEYNDTVFLFGDYWATVADDEWKKDPVLADMCNEMTRVLAKIEELRGDKIENTIALDGLVDTYEWFINEDLLQEIANSTLDELKGSLDNIIAELEKYNVEITSAVREAIALVPDDVQEFLDGTENIVKGMRDELSEIYLEYYNEEREALSREDYDGFYSAIISQYGSLEAYWQSRNQ